MPSQIKIKIDKDGYLWCEDATGAMSQRVCPFYYNPHSKKEQCCGAWCALFSVRFFEPWFSVLRDDNKTFVEIELCHRSFSLPVEQFRDERNTNICSDEHQ